MKKYIILILAIISMIYVFTGVKAEDTMLPTIPYMPNFAKNSFISFPDAKPAPIKVPIIIEIILIFSLKFFKLYLPCLMILWR